MQFKGILLTYRYLEFAVQAAQKMKDMCCVSVKRQAVGGLVLFDNLCMN